jgi:hypothetical protein
MRVSPCGVSTPYLMYLREKYGALYRLPAG